MEAPRRGDHDAPHKIDAVERADVGARSFCGDLKAFMSLYVAADGPAQQTMVQELHKTVSDLHKAIAFLNRISGELNIENLMDMVRSMALEVLDCERVTLFLVDDAKQELRGKPAEALNEPVLKVPFGEGVAGRLAETGELLNVEDAYQCPFFSNKIDQLTGFRTRSILCYPITDLANNTVAVLEAVNKKSGAFTCHDASALNLFVLQIGNTFAKSQLHQHAVKEGAKVATLAKYTQQMRHARGLEELLSVSRSAMMELVDAQHVLIFLADTARSQLWAKLDREDGLYTIVRTDTRSDMIGRCFTEAVSQTIDAVPDTDAAFNRLKRILAVSEYRSVLAHPIVRDGLHEKLGVILAVNKLPSASSILFDDLYSAADKAMTSLFCRDFYEILLEHAVEMSFVSALSTVLPDGTNANADLKALLQSQLLHYSDVSEEYMQTLRLCTSSRYAESDGALHTLVQRSYPRSMSSVQSAENGNAVSKKARTRSDLGPIDHLRTWTINFLDLSTEELVKLCFDIFKDICPKEYPIQDEVVICFLTAVASHYRDNPYHTFLHACYVLHSVWMILTTTDLPHYVLPHETLALCIAAICHDVDHDGLTNQFHVNSGSEVARRYNDVSVLENHHCALTFAILERRNCALLENLPKHIQTEIRRVMIQYIMGTDMSHHLKLSSELCQLELPQRGGENGSMVCPVEDRVFLCKAVLHAADISNPVRSFEVDFFMAERVQTEFKMQTDKEKRLGLPVLPHMDLKTDTMKYQAEVNFIDFIVTPLWKRLAQLLPSLNLCLHQMKSNREKFVRLTEIAESKELSTEQDS